MPGLFDRSIATSPLAGLYGKLDVDHAFSSQAYPGGLPNGGMIPMPSNAGQEHLESAGLDPGGDYSAQIISEKVTPFDPGNFQSPQGPWVNPGNASIDPGIGQFKSRPGSGLALVPHSVQNVLAELLRQQMMGG